MVAWLTRIFLILGGAVASWFVAEDAPNYSVIQGVAAMLLLASMVAVLAFWPKRWSAFLNRIGPSGQGNLALANQAKSDNPMAGHDKPNGATPG